MLVKVNSCRCQELNDSMFCTAGAVFLGLYRLCIISKNRKVVLKFRPKLNTIIPIIKLTFS